MAHKTNKVPLMPKDKKSSELSRAMVYQHNDLIDAVYRLSVSAKRVLLMCISQVGDKDLASDFVSDGFECYFTTAQYIERFCPDVKSKTQAYKDIYAAVEEILSATAKFIDIKDGVEQTHWFAWMVQAQAADAKTERGEYMLKLNASLFDYIGLLRGKFTEYALGDVERLTSFNQIRLYEMFCRWRGAGKWSTNFEYFRSERFALSDSVKSKPFALKARFLLDAIEKINETTPLFVQFEDRGVNSWVFHIHTGEKAEKLTAELMRVKAEKELEKKAAKKLAALQK